MLSENIKRYILSSLSVTSEKGITELQSLTDGKSGSEVYRIRVNSSRSRNSGIYIVKLTSINSLWYDEKNNEATANEVLQTNIEDFKNRIVKKYADSIVDDYHVMIFRQANDSILKTVSLEKLKLSEQQKVISVLAYELLNNWNLNCHYESKPISDLFFSALSYRLEENGTFIKRINCLLEKSEAKAICINKTILPNPHYYIFHINEWAEKAQNISFFIGNVHGDLHRKNILCSKENTGNIEIDYFLIDYDTYSYSKGLFFDHAYLELSIYFDTIFVEQDTKSLYDTICKIVSCDLFSDISNTVDEPVLNLRNSICQGIKRWKEEHFTHVSDDIIIQYLIMQIIVGANYFSKSKIVDDNTLEKLLMYMGVCFRRLFEIIDFEWKAEDVSKLCYPLSQKNNVDDLWEKSIKKINRRIPVLITDDYYSVDDYNSNLEGLYLIDLSLVIDIGKNASPNDIKTNLFKKLSNHKHVLLWEQNEKGTQAISNNTCIIFSDKKESSVPSYGVLWKNDRESISQIFDVLLSNGKMQPFMFVFDIHVGIQYAKNLFQYLLEKCDKLKGSFFVLLGKTIISEDDSITIKHSGLDYYELKHADLLDVSLCAKTFISSSVLQKKAQSIVLPTIDTIDTCELTEIEITHYETSVELVYSGKEGESDDLDFGYSFYHGEEIKWSDLANNYDLPLVENYEEKRNELIRIVEKESPRVKSVKLIHGAGTGGTTLAKRLLWDLKDQFPCIRLKKYTEETPSIIMDIYKRTGKRVFLSIEMGSTVISSDDLKTLMSIINEENGRLLVLQIERSDRVSQADQNTVFINLHDTLRENLALNFYNKFKAMTKDIERINYLYFITAKKGDWMEQRCPFFYGFYTFQEEYHFENSIKQTIKCCDNDMRAVLSDMAINTIYSQNICIQFSELCARLNKDPDSTITNIYESFDSSISKLLVQKDDGLRICHPLIAKRIIIELYSDSNYGDALYSATINYIDHLYSLYDSNNNYSDDVLRELIIDRSYIDSERTRFSNLIENMTTFNQKESVFKKLIEKYPKNPHYYNHLARLLAEDSTNHYEPSIELLKKAIEIANEENLPTSTHYITLGCIYGKQILTDIKENLILKRNNRLSSSLVELIDSVEKTYLYANLAFQQGRQNAAKNNIYVYFPQINLETEIIKRVVSYDAQNRSLNDLNVKEGQFRSFYIEHYNKAAYLLMEMQNNFESYDESYLDYLKKATERVNSVDENEPKIVSQLEKWTKEDGSFAYQSRRLYSLSLFIRNGNSWKNTDKKALQAVKNSMTKNLLNGRNGEKEPTDIRCWFEAAKRLDDFNPDECIRMIEDYMEDGYKKEYILFYLDFLLLEKGISNYSKIMQHINKCKAMLPSGINSATSRDAYFDLQKGCPILPFNEIERDKSGIMLGLMEFTGTITQIKRTTIGYISVDVLGVEAYFTPSIKDENNKRREFTMKNITDRVKFNLMFSYSGFRAWNVQII